MTPSSIGQRVKELREAAHMSQEELAQQTGMTQGAISDIERGETKYPRRSSLAQIERAVGRPGALVAPPAHAPSLEEAVELLAIYTELPTPGRVALLSAARGLQEGQGGLSIDV